MSKGGGNRFSCPTAFADQLLVLGGAQRVSMCPGVVSSIVVCA